MTAERRTEHESRLAALRGVLDRRGIPAVLLEARRNVAWLTAGAATHVVTSTEASVAPLLVTRDAIACITQNIEAARIGQEELDELDVEIVPVPWWESGAVAAEAAQRAGGQPAGDTDIESDLVPLRSVLSPFDRARMALLGEAGSAAVDDALARIEPGATEEDLAAELVARLPGLRAPVVLVAADDRIARYRHPIATRARIERRVMLVLVVERWGLHVALTRIRDFSPPSADIEARMAAVAEVEQAMHAATRAGATLGDVLAAAQSAYAAAGFPDEWRDHHQGGTIAYLGRETVATPGDPTPMEAGMAFAWNPSIAGAKVEDTFILEEGGSQRIVTAG